MNAHMPLSGVRSVIAADAARRRQRPWWRAQILLRIWAVIIPLFGSAYVVLEYLNAKDQPSTVQARQMAPATSAGPLLDPAPAAPSRVDAPIPALATPAPRMPAPVFSTAVQPPPETRSVTAPAAPAAIAAPTPPPATQAAVAPSAPVVSPGPAAVAPVAPPPSAATLELIRRGEDLLYQGEIISARRLFERAASSGNPQAATGVGRTYDPAVIESHNPPAGVADRDAAASWYRRGAALGDPEAARRLRDVMAVSGN